MGGEPVQYLVCELLGKARIQRLPAQEQAVEDRPVELVDGELQVGIRPELPTLPAPFERFEHRPAASRHDVAVEPLGQLRIVLQVGDEPGEDPSSDRLGEHGDQPAKELSDVLAHFPLSGGG